MCIGLRVDRESIGADAAHSIAEELDVGFRQRGAANGIGHVIKGAARERLFHDRRVFEPNDDLARIAAGHLRCEQIRAGFLSGVCTVICLSKWSGRGSSVNSHAATCRPTYSDGFCCTRRIAQIADI